MLKASIHLRLSLSTLLLLTVFLGLTGLLLGNAQRVSLESEIESRLLGHVYALLAEARESAAGQLELPVRSTDPRLNQPDSGVAAELAGHGGEILWRSGSLLGMESTPLPVFQAGRQQFYRDEAGYQLLFALEWEGTDGGLQPYTMRIGLRSEVTDKQSQRFQQRLWGGLLLLGLILLVLQALLLRWGLSPLRQVSHSLKEIESGNATFLEGRYPGELQPLVDNLNSLIQFNRVQQDRVRSSLDDLAHSIKTPLALLQCALDSDQVGSLSEAATQAVPQIDAIVKGRLQRAVIRGHSGLGQRVALHRLAQRMIDTLAKVYHQRRLLIGNRVPEDLLASADENDLMEILGNLLDNACKFARRQVQVDAGLHDGCLWLRIEDDGPGIAETQIAQVMRRGERLDEHHPGQGIGLAAIHGIADLYQGDLVISRSGQLGGAAVTLRFGSKLSARKS
jgi:two-component system sensor histidine kinase PhoQ